MPTAVAEFKPKILVFSTEKISDPGIDLAGLLKLYYPSTTLTITLPCSSMVKPKWVLYALQKGFDGVFIAADGTDCPYLPDCTDRTAKVIMDSIELLKQNGFNPSRVKMAAICSVCAEPFSNHIKSFYENLKKIGPAKEELESATKGRGKTNGK